MKAADLMKLLKKYGVLERFPDYVVKNGRVLRKPVGLVGTSFLFSGSGWEKRRCTLFFEIFPLYAPTYGSGILTPICTESHWDWWYFMNEDEEQDKEEILEMERGMNAYLKKYDQYLSIQGMAYNLKYDTFSSSMHCTSHIMKYKAYAAILCSDKKRALDEMNNFYNYCSSFTHEKADWEIDMENHMRKMEALLREDIILAQEELLAIRRQNIEKFKWEKIAIDYTVDDLKQFAHNTKYKKFFDLFKRKRA